MYLQIIYSKIDNFASVFVLMIIIGDQVMLLPDDLIAGL